MQLWILQTNGINRREWMLSLFLIFFLIIAIYFWLTRLFFPTIKLLNNQARMILFYGAGILSFLLVLALPLPRLLTIILPTHEIEISIPETNENSLFILKWFTTDIGDVSFSQFQKTGSWERTEEGLIHKGKEAATLSWKGKVGENSLILYQFESSNQNAKILQDGLNPTIIIPSNGGKELTKSIFWGIEYGNRILAGLISWIFIFVIIITFLLLVSKIPAKNPNRSGFSKFFWLQFSVPMLIAWGVFLLAFWPAMMFDSAKQWDFLLYDIRNDATPYFYTAFIYLITRIWFSPSFIVAFQIITLSLVVSWGLGMLIEHGLPRWAAWITTAFIISSPIVGNMVVFIQKDSLYSIALLYLTLILLKIVLTKGDWLSKPLIWVLLGLVSLFISSLRHNGFPIPLVTFVSLFAFYRPWRRQILLSVLLCFGLYFFIHVPLYNILNVSPSTGFKQQVWIHKIAAHTNKGGPLTETEQYLYDQNFAGINMKYDCCNVLETTRDSGWGKNPKAIQSLLILLTLKEPLIEYQHLVCSGSMVWELESRCKITSLEPESTTEWLANYNPNLVEDSKFPQLAAWLAIIILKINDDSRLFFLISPAFFFVLGFLFTLVLSFRWQSEKIFLFMLPATVQSSVLLLVNTAPEIRYQFSILLIGLFSIGLFLLSFYKIPLTWRKTF